MAKTEAATSCTKGTGDPGFASTMRPSPDSHLYTPRKRCRTLGYHRREPVAGRGLP